MKAIVAVDANWGIGYCGDLLVKIAEDMKFFKQTTLGKVIIMGRETFESLPGKEPLKDRINIVLSTKAYSEDERITVCRSLEELSQVLEQYHTDDVFVIGGEKVYAQLLPYCSEAYVTKIENTYKADKYFVNLDKVAVWKPVACSDCKCHNEIRYRFTRYENTFCGDFKSFKKSVHGF